MALRELKDPAGAPWERPRAGRLDRLVVESDLLADNPLGDPARRPLWVYLPTSVDPDAGEQLASVYVIQGYSGQLDGWARREPFQPTMLELVDDLFSRGDCPPAVVVFVDAWTAYGGSQFLDSAATGPYSLISATRSSPSSTRAIPHYPRLSTAG